MGATKQLWMAERIKQVLSEPPPYPHENPNYQPQQKGYTIIHQPKERKS